MSDDVTGKDEAITAQAIVMAATHWDAYKPPEQLLEAACQSSEIGAIYCYQVSAVTS